MLPKLLKQFFLLLSLFCARQALGPANCQQAVTLTNLQNFCSAAGAYQTTATNKLYWFKFTAVQSDISLTVTGGTLATPEVHLLSDCIGTELVGTGTQSATLFKGGLVTGQENIFSPLTIATQETNSLPCLMLALFKSLPA